MGCSEKRGVDSAIEFNTVRQVLWPGMYNDVFVLTGGDVSLYEKYIRERRYNKYGHNRGIPDAG